MTRQEFFIPSHDGVTTLHGYTWTPEGEVKAVYQMVHGMTEYIDRYDGFATFLAENHIAVIGHDHLGHGKSVIDADHLGYFAKENGDELLLQDMHEVMNKGKELFPNVPNFIMGHSMGSFLVRRYLTRYGNEVTGAVVMGTGFIPAGLAGFGKTLSKMIRKTKGEFYRSQFLTNLALGSNNKPFAPNRTNVDWLTKDEAIVDKYVKDPLCTFKFTSSAFVDFFGFIQALGKMEGADQIPKDLPILVTSGEVDPVGGKTAVEKLNARYQKMGLTNVKTKIYPNDRHEILNELDKSTVYQDILNWVLSYIPT